MATKKQTYVCVTFGWDHKYAVPTEKLSTLLSLLEECPRVSDKSVRVGEDWINHVFKTKKAYRPNLEIIAELLDEEPFDAASETA